MPDAAVRSDLDYLDTKALCEELACKVTWWYRHRKRLEREEGFPLPARHGRWLRLSVRLWKLRQAGLTSDQVIAAGEADIDGTLHRRAAAIAERFGAGR